MALMIDLGLNKAISPRGKTALGSMAYFRPPDRQSSTERTLEERRAFLGVLYVTSSQEFLSLHYSFLQVFLYEVAVHDTIANTGYGALPMTRLKMLFTCLDVVKQFFENFGAISPAHYFNFTYFTWSLAGHVSVVLSKLCIFSGDSWDPNFARSTIDFPAMVHEMQEKLKQAAALAEQSVRHTPQAQSPYR
ncbi:hypothetical protein LTS07_002421 [Exophiala sideris]|uniref:Protein kinase domain-containing protein n=1 Tax=Exophiala sideris TaxID=1016849 RepID=A0ABR0JMH0_9EURO|nr:hypothetical protein LTS07_002421 [Exophiala sideris]KAK5067077.1 hypothetical protein LTR69_002426 [Exophiala sideris]KAK5185135.1 hypothetical protein LTR44_002982 [Eurotiomycetes sp. CCFEE 6388]